jgi:hypothetical protein
LVKYPFQCVDISEIKEHIKYIYNNPSDIVSFPTAVIYTNKIKDFKQLQTIINYSIYNCLIKDKLGTSIIDCLHLDEPCSTLKYFNFK